MKVGARASISTEFRVSGPEGLITWDPSVYLFTKEFLEEIFRNLPDVIVIGGFEQIDPSRVESSESPTDLLTFLTSEKSYLQGEKEIYPNLLMAHLGFRFCSIHLELEKVQHTKAQPSDEFHKKVTSADAARFMALNKNVDSNSKIESIATSPTMRLRARLRVDYLDVLAAFDFYRVRSRNPIKRFIASLMVFTMKIAGKLLRTFARRYF
jgi:hypothetical protein